MNLHNDSNHNKDSQKHIFMQKPFGDQNLTESWYVKFLSLKSIIIKFILFVIVALGIFWGMDWVKAYQLQKTQEAYVLAQNSGEWEDFYYHYSKTKLGLGVAMQFAIKAYQQNDFPRAVELYTKVMNARSLDILRDQAILGKAISCLKNNQISEGEELLNEIIQDPSIDIPIKEQAYYQKAILAIANADYKSADTYFSKLSTLNNQSIWTTKIQQIKNIIPQLN